MIAPPDEMLLETKIVNERFLYVKAVNTETEAIVFYILDIDLLRDQAVVNPLPNTNIINLMQIEKLAIVSNEGKELLIKKSEVAITQDILERSYNKKND
jgi:hypothetical protein